MYCNRLIKTNFLANNYSFITSNIKTLFKYVIIVYNTRLKNFLINSIQTFAANYKTLYLQLVA
jgi:hypothetical protein